MPSGSALGSALGAEPREGRPPLDPLAARLFAGRPAAAIRAGLIGRAIGPSRTPGMHVAEGRRLGLDYAYDLLDFDRLELADDALPRVLRAAAAAGCAGLNVTHPFKQSVLPWLDGVAPEAEAIGAVNTVVFRDGRATGHNTDCFGFAESFRREMAGAALDRVLLLGAGGAGAAVGQALLGLGAAGIDVYDVDGDRAAALARRLGTQPGGARAGAVDDLASAARLADGLVNATPVGMAKYPGTPLPPACLRPDLWVADVIYFPAATALIAAARAAGCRTLPGRGMAIHQAVRAFEFFTGRPPDPEAMAAHFDAQGH